MAPDATFIILIDTATDICSIAISANDKVLDFQVDKSGERRHASLLPGMIETTLQKVSLSLQDISAVAYSKGPGSYTGLRVGLSTAKALGMACNLPLIGISTLLGLSYSVSNPAANSLIIAMIDAGRDEVYHAIYNDLNEELVPASPLILTQDSFCNKYREYSKLYLTGDGAVKAERILLAEDRLVYVNGKSFAQNLVEPAFKMYKEGNFENLAYSVPEYLKYPQYKKSI